MWFGFVKKNTLILKKTISLSSFPKQTVIVIRVEKLSIFTCFQYVDDVGRRRLTNTG